MATKSGRHLIRRVPLGNSGLEVSDLAFGTSAIGGEFRPVDESEAVSTIVAAFEAGITLFDSAPAYGATLAERLLGEALASIPRDEVVICTKVGKQTAASGVDRFDYSEAAIRSSFEASCNRLGSDVIDILLLHDIDAPQADTAQALLEGIATLRALKDESKVRAIGAGFYSIPIWKHLLANHSLDVALIPNHHTLVDVRLFELLPLTEALGIGVISAAPFGSGLLTGAELPSWHTAPSTVRESIQMASQVAEYAGTTLPELALSFATHEPRVPITLFSCRNRLELTRNLRWASQLPDRRVVAEVQRVLEAAMNVDWQRVVTKQ